MAKKINDKVAATGTSANGKDPILSVSKNQQRAGERARKAARTAPVAYGGTCSACGQKSTSCRTGTPHADCKGWSHQEDVSDLHAKMPELLRETSENPYTVVTPAEYFGGRYLRADLADPRDTCDAHGNPIPGTWLSPESMLSAQVKNEDEQLLKTLKRREKFAEEQCKIEDSLRAERHFSYATDEDGKYIAGGDCFLNGLGEPIQWVPELNDLKGAWMTVYDAEGYYERLSFEMEQVEAVPIYTDVLTTVIGMADTMALDAEILAARMPINELSSDEEALLAQHTDQMDPGGDVSERAKSAGAALNREIRELVEGVAADASASWDNLLPGLQTVSLS